MPFPNHVCTYYLSLIDGCKTNLTCWFETMLCLYCYVFSKMVDWFCNAYQYCASINKGIDLHWTSVFPSIFYIFYYHLILKKLHQHTWSDERPNIFKQFKMLAFKLILFTYILLPTVLLFLAWKEKILWFDVRNMPI